MSGILPLVVAGLVTGSVYGLAGVGLVLTYRTSGVFNFAHGTVAAVAAFAFYQLHNVNGLPWPVALVFCIGVGGPLLGIALERMARTLSNAAIAFRIVATVGLIIGVQQLVILRYGAMTRQFPAFLPTRTLTIAGVRVGIDQLIVMLVAVCATVGLSRLLRSTRLGMSMRAAVDNETLLALAGTSPTSVRRWSWCIGAMFACVSGVLIAPSTGLDVNILTLLVVQAFGAAAIGLFRSLPLTFMGGIAIGVAAAVSSKYIGEIRVLAGVPASLPFVVLFGLLLFAPKGWLKAVGVEHKRPLPTRMPASRLVRLVGPGLGLLVLALVPNVVGNRIGVYTAGLVFVLVFLSLSFLDRISGQVSLGQMTFAAIGAVTFSHLSHGAGLPWLLAVAIAGLIAMPIGALLAIPAVRLSPLYLALATFGFGLLAERMAFNTSLMFGSGLNSLVTPRPSFATTDTQYYFLVLFFVLGGVSLVTYITRNRLGRLLRAMADSSKALLTHGMNVTVLNVLAFSIAAGLASLAGALLGPVTGQVSTNVFLTFASLQLVAILALHFHLGQIGAAFASAIAFRVVPSYDELLPLPTEWLPVFFGASAVIVAMVHSRTRERSSPLAKHRDALVYRLSRSPIAERLADVRTRRATEGEAWPAQPASSSTT